MSQPAPPTLIELDDYRPVWATSKARCGACGHRWIAAWPAGLGSRDHGWECSACGQLAGLEVERVLG
jgi:transposase